MSRRVLQTSSKHDCSLPKSLLQREVRSPYQTWINDLFQDFKKKLIVSSNFQSRRYYRSTAAIRVEQKRHKRHPKYRKIIHPFSTFNIVKELFIWTVWFFLLLFEPYIGAFAGAQLYGEEAENYVTDILLLSLNLIMGVDFISRFFVGIPLEQIREVILEPNLIVNWYLCTFCFFDVIPILSCAVFYFAPLPPKLLLCVFQLHKLRLVRTNAFLNHVELYMWQFEIRSALRTVVIFALMVIIILHEWTCIAGLINLIWYMYDLPSNNSWLYQYNSNKRKLSVLAQYELLGFGEDLTISKSLWLYFVHFAAVLSYFCGCLPHEFFIKTGVERVLFSLILISGLTFYVYAMAQILQIVGMLNVSEAKYEEMVFGLEDYMTKKNFPVQLKKRIFKYYDCKYNKKFFSEQRISNSLSDHLRMEILLYSCRNLITEVKMFKGLSKSAVGCILALLQQEIYLTNDVIVRTDNDTEDSIYFVLYGTCGIYLPSGKEVHHVEDGSHFGNTNTYAEDTQVHFLYSVVALEVSEVYQLKKNDVNYCCKAYPEIVFKLEAMVKNKAREYNHKFAVVEKEEEITDEILTQLRRGKILRSGLKREDFEDRR